MLRHLAFRALVSMGLALCAVPVVAADFADPTWPCVQRKVDNLSLGLMWPDPVEADTLPSDPAILRDIDDLAGSLALRRIDTADLEAPIAAFAEKYGGDPVLLGHVFARTFEALSKRRTRIISGIADFSLGQIALSEKIDASRAEMDAVMAKDAPDYDRADALEEQIDWDQVIFTDRQRNIQYLCETPVLLERRLFSIAQMLQFVAE